MAFFLSSSAFENNHPIPVRYTCDGLTISPPLSIGEIPESARSLALFCEDPDSVAGVWDHWIMWNIHVITRSIEEGKVPEGVIEGKNTFGKIGWGGPCPRKGDRPHRYVFTLFALDSSLDVGPGAAKREVTGKMDGHIVEKTTLTGLYQRNQ